MEWKSSQYLQNISYWIQSGFTQISVTESLTSGNMELGSADMGFLTVLNFLEMIICIKNFFLSKTTIIL